DLGLCRREGLRREGEGKGGAMPRGFPPNYGMPGGVPGVPPAGVGSGAPSGKYKPTAPGPGGGETDPGKTFEATAAGQSPEKALVRFVDADVKPGDTYRYSIQVRMATPTHGKTKDVASEDYAKPEVLESVWVVTEPVTVSPELEYYPVDQKELTTDGKWHPHKGADTQPLSAAPGRVA